MMPPAIFLSWHSKKLPEKRLKEALPSKLMKKRWLSGKKHYENRGGSNVLTVIFFNQVIKKETCKKRAVLDIKAGLHTVAGNKSQ